jgi:hypothetical protein
MTAMDGHRVWVVPDGWLPPAGGCGDLVNHESLMILNTGGEDAKVRLDIYFADRAPVRDLRLTVAAERVRAVRMDDPSDLGHALPRATQYALRIESDVAIIVQFGRMDVRQPNLAYYGVMAFPVEQH